LFTTLQDHKTKSVLHNLAKMRALDFWAPACSGKQSCAKKSFRTLTEIEKHVFVVSVDEMI
jgi:hypothetical protein